MSALIIKRVASRILLVRLRERSSRAAHTRVTLRERGRERGRFRKTCRKWKRGRVTHPSLFAAEKRSGGLTSSERWTFRWEFLPDKSHPPFFVLFAARCRLSFARLLKKIYGKKGGESKFTRNKRGVCSYSKLWFNLILNDRHECCWIFRRWLK